MGHGSGNPAIQSPGKTWQQNGCPKILRRGTGYLRPRGSKTRRLTKRSLSPQKRERRTSTPVVLGEPGKCATRESLDGLVLVSLLVQPNVRSKRSSIYAETVPVMSK